MTETSATFIEDKSTIERITSNALEHFSRFGYVGANIREITAASEVTKPTLYYYFQNKEELYRNLAASSFNSLLGVLKESAAQNGTLPTRFRAFVEAYYFFCEKNLAAARFIQNISRAPSRDVPDVGIENFEINVKEIIFSLIKDATDAGEITDEQQLGLQFILQSLFALVVDRRLKGLHISSEDLQRTLGCLAFQKK